MSICPPTWPTSLHHIPFDISCRIFRFQTIKDRRSYCHHYDYDHMIIAIIILWQCLWRRWSWNNFSTGDNACNENHFVTVENCEKKYFSTGESLTKTNFPFEGMVGYYATFDLVNVPSTPQHHLDIFKVTIRSVQQNISEIWTKNIPKSPRIIWRYSKRYSDQK